MTAQWTSLHGIIVQGYRVASGRQRIIRTAHWTGRGRSSSRRGLDLTRYFNGTLNIDIRSHTFRLIKPEYTFQQVEWTDLHPPEHFSFSRCQVIYKHVEYEGWVYYPHPETKLRHFQDPSILEVISYEIPGIQYGNQVQVLVNLEEIEVSQTT